MRKIDIRKEFHELYPYLQYFINTSNVILKIHFDLLGYVSVTDFSLRSPVGQSWFYTNKLAVGHDNTWDDMSTGHFSINWYF